MGTDQTPGRDDHLMGTDQTRHLVGMTTSWAQTRHVEDAACLRHVYILNFNIAKMRSRDNISTRVMADIMDREEQRDTKMHCTFNILNYYKDSRLDMYIRYILRLFELHFTANNFVEAGLTLKLYAQLLKWSVVKLPPEMSYPSATEAERKEELYKRIIECFDKGKAWEYGIPLCKELGEFYERSFQYNKLAEILRKQATFYQHILEGANLRQDPTFYRVAYYGNTFPPYLKNKAFIYRGDECLKLATIMNQLTTEYPSAQILTSNLPVDESCKRGDTQFVQLVSVKPIPSERQEFLGKEVPNEISSFYNTNEVDTFQFDRPYHRNDKDKNNEFKSLCLERTIMKSAYPLPGILRWYEVVKTETVHFCPVQTAYFNVQQMNKELKTSADNAVNNPEQCLSHLTMRLQGVISGAVNGGIPKYQEAFFNETYQRKYPDESEHIERLKSAIQEQIQLLERGLSIQGKFASQEMLPLHRSLVEMFSKMKSSMGYQNTASSQRGSNTSFLSSGSSQRPSTPSSGSFNSSGSNRSSVVSGDANDDDDSKYIEPEYQGPSLVSCLEPVSQDPPPVIPRKPSFPGVSADGPASGKSLPPLIPEKPILGSSISRDHKPPLMTKPTFSEEANETDSVPPLPPRTVISTPTTQSDATIAKTTPPLPTRKSSFPPPFIRNFNSETNLSSCGKNDAIYNNSHTVDRHNLSQSSIAPAPPPPRSPNFTPQRTTVIQSPRDPPPPLPETCLQNSVPSTDTVPPLPTRETPPCKLPPPIPSRRPSQQSNQL
ncbi:Dedicator of cytokinesis protein 4 [Bulinus truncatus]|nr:Dedicator of cytokinesis protein 4 [Bulinus truncatus]